MRWMGERRFTRMLGLIGLLGFPILMLEHGPRHAWREWRELFWPVPTKEPDDD